MSEMDEKLVVDLESPSTPPMPLSEKQNGFNIHTLPYYLCIVGAAICWSFTGFFNRTMGTFGFDAQQVLFIRCLVPAAILAIVMIAVDRKAFRLHLKDLWVFFGGGLLSLTMFGVAYMNALREMSLSIAVVLLYTSPIWVIIISSICFYEKITPAKILALVLVAVGALFTTGAISGDFTITPMGFVLGLVSGLGYGLYSVFTRFAYNKGYNGLTVNFYFFLFSSIAVGFICDVPDVVSLAFTPSADVVAGGGSVLVIVVVAIAMGAVTCLIPYVLYAKGLEKVENGPASITASVEMVATSITGVIIYSEIINLSNILGIVLVFAGIFAMNTRLFGSKRNRSRNDVSTSDHER